MKKCILCKRVVMGKTILGMCPICFLSMLDGLAIAFFVLLCLLIPVISVVLFGVIVVVVFIALAIVAAYIISPISEAILNILGIGLDVLVGIVAVIIGVISLVASLLILLFLDGIILFALIAGIIFFVKRIAGRTNLNIGHKE